MPMKMFFKKLHARFYRYSVAAFIYIFYPILYFFSRKPSRYPKMNVFRKICGWLSSAIAGIFYTYEFEEPIDWSRTYIICPNHSSSLDITGVTLMMKNNFCFIGKEEFVRNPALGIFFKTIDIPVNRESKISSFRAFKKAGERLQGGMSVIIFPEGKIPKDYPPSLNEFKNGPFRLAIELKIPIIPVTSKDTWKILWDTGLVMGSTPGVCKLHVHKVIETAHLTLDDADDLRDRVFNLMNERLTAK
jgi:1-acyl-sn-glycerol-3-phosphate acyltransferase